MAKTCGKCGKKIPSSAWIDGRKKTNLQHRRYCLECSPFGSRNTRRLEQVRRSEELDITCRTCGKPLSPNQRKGRRCWNCCFAERAENRLDRAYAIVGDRCWRCGYTRGRAGRRILDFHHVDRTEKRFQLDARHVVNLAWDRVLLEMKKCVLLCANCHREVETGLVEPEEVRRLHERHWTAASDDGELK
jgi:hypothetical protein